MDLAYDFMDNFVPLRNDLVRIKKKTTQSRYLFLSKVKDARTIYNELNKISEGLSIVAKNPSRHIELVEHVQTRHAEIQRDLEKLRQKCKRLKAIRFPLSEEIYGVLNKMIKTTDNINRIDIHRLKEKGVDEMLTSERKITSKPYPMLISMGLYIIIFLAVAILTVMDIIPVFSSILGGIIGFSFFLSALDDFKRWRKTYAK